MIITSAVAEREKFPGIIDFIRKPYDLEELLSVIAEHCEPEN